MCIHFGQLLKPVSLDKLKNTHFCKTSDTLPNKTAMIKRSKEIQNHHQPRTRLGLKRDTLN